MKLSLVDIFVRILNIHELIAVSNFINGKYSIKYLLKYNTILFGSTN